jgi:hypothetical protein
MTASELNVCIALDSIPFDYDVILPTHATNHACDTMKECTIELLVHKLSNAVDMQEHYWSPLMLSDVRKHERT